MIPQTLKDAVDKDRTGISNYIIQLSSPKICEVGVRFGNHFRKVFTDNVEIAVAVDPWRLFESQDCDPDASYTQQDLDKQYEDFTKSFDGDKRVIVERDISLNAAQKYSDNYFDFIYIDGNHKYGHCKNDLNAWWSKVKVGGILAGHDYINVRDFGVIQAVTEFKLENNILEENIFINQEEYASYYILKV